ncbi:uncharacterized protein mrvi1 [Hoplias malabaricus]|uniref:uncharacterized protein mrvi1 n=1 Tax=Hoplias malabaricus TaxID=27720 RepID=UPI003462C6B6
MDFAEDIEPTSPSYQPKTENSNQTRGQHGYTAPSLSFDSGTWSIEQSPMLDFSETFRPDSMDLCELDMNGFSEEELLNITFETCDTAGQGEVQASTVVQYLQTMTEHSHGQDKLTVLQHMLDPEGTDALISRDTFHTIMTKWIAQCSQDSEPSDLLGLVVELKHAQHKLTGQNSSLLKTMSQCEEANLQLTLEVSELRSKLARCTVITPEMKESEHLKAHIKAIEEQNERLMFERNCAEDRLNKLKRATTDMREELEETHVLLEVKEREVTKSLQSDMMRLQEHSQQALLRFDKCALSPPGLKREAITNHYSLHHEILDAQPWEHPSKRNPSTWPQMMARHSGHRVKELELLRAPWEEQEHSLAKAKRQAEEARRAAAVTWWRALRLENERNRAGHGVQEATREMQAQISTLEAQLRAAQLESLAQKKQNTRKLRDAQSQTGAERKNIGVETEQSIDKSGQEAEICQEDAEKLLEALKRVEVKVGGALQTTDQLTEGHRRVKEKLEAISHRVEHALNRTTCTQRQLSALEALVSSSTQLSSDISANFDVTSKDVIHPVVCSSITCSELKSTSQLTCLHLSSLTNGGSLLRAGAEDNSHKDCNNKKASLLTDDPADPSDVWLNCAKSFVPQASSDLLPVGLVSKQSPPEEKTCERVSAAVHSHLPETAPLLGPACEELTDSHTWENVAWSEDPDYGAVSLSESQIESKSSITVLEEGGSGQTTNPEGNECPRLKQEDSGSRREESASLGRSYSQHFGGSRVSESAEKGQNLEEEHGECDRATDTNLRSTESLPKSLGNSKEESEASGKSQEQTRSSRILKDTLTSWTSHAAELGSGKERSSQTSQAASVQAPQPVTTYSAGTPKDFSALCGEEGSAVEWVPPTSCLVVVESYTSFIFPHTRSRPPGAPTMPTLPEEEEDSPEEVDSSSSSPSTYIPVETKVMNVTIAPPAIVLPRQTNKQESCPLEKARPHSPRPRLSRTSGSSGPITTVDNDGHVIDLVKDQLPEMQLSEEDRQKNLELLEEAKKVSDRFLTRRGRRSTCSLTESPTALSPNPTPGSSPVPSRSSSLSAPPQPAVSATEVTVTASPPTSPPTVQRLEIPAVRDHGEPNKPDQESLNRLVDWKPPEKRKVSSGTLTPRHAAAAQAREPSGALKSLDSSQGKKPGPPPAVQKPDSQTPATGVAKPVPRPPTQQAPCTAEIKTIGAFPPLMRAVSWDTVGPVRNGAPNEDESPPFSDKLKSPGYRDFPLPPVPKLSKLREEHKLMRNQSISGSKLPDLSETAEQDRGPLSPTSVSPSDEESKEKADAMPNISDIMLRKLKLHRGLPGCAPPLTEKEVENAFVQLSLAFRNDNYTLETRLKQAERERNLTEENTEKELEEFKNSLKSTATLWQNAEQRESYQRLVETVAVLNRLANRLSSRAEMVGAVRQEKRMNKATEVMMQYVENLKRTYEKDHAELMEFKKLANQNSNRCYTGSLETGDDGVPRASRSMSLTMGKALPRRRVSVAVVPKFNLLNIPGQTPVTAGPGPTAGLASAGPSTGPGALPILCEANGTKSESSSDPAQQAAGENGKVVAEQEGEAAASAKASCSIDEIRAEIKAKIEEEAYNKGYQEGLKRMKELQEVKEEEEKAEEKLLEPEEITGDESEKEKKPNSRYAEALEVLDRICPKIFKQNRTLWIVLTLFLVSFLVVNLINLFSNHYSVQEDTSTEKSAVPGKKKFFGLHVGSNRPTPE